MTDHWTGIAETGTQAGRRFPAATLLPGATVTPAADWFAPWRVPLGTVPLNEPAAVCLDGARLSYPTDYWIESDMVTVVFPHELEAGDQVSMLVFTI